MGFLPQMRTGCQHSNCNTCKLLESRVCILYHILPNVRWSSAVVRCAVHFVPLTKKTYFMFKCVNNLCLRMNKTRPVCTSVVSGTVSYTWKHKIKVYQMRIQMTEDGRDLEIGLLFKKKNKRRKLSCKWTCATSLLSSRKITCPVLGDWWFM